MKHVEQGGLASEQKVIAELKRRGIPCRHRVQIDYYEIDIVVGNRIIIEVDGYVHLTKESIIKDRRKDDYFRELGYIVLRVTGSEVRNRGALREFGQKVSELWKEQQARDNPQQSVPLTQSMMDQSVLKEFRDKLVTAEQNKAKRGKVKTKKQDKPASAQSDRELFLQWIQRETPPKKD